MNLLTERLSASEKRIMELTELFNKNIIPEYKICSQCKEEKHFLKYRLKKEKGKKIFLRCECIECSKKYTYLNKPVTKDNKEKRKNSFYKWRNKNKDYERIKIIKNKYNLTIDEYNTLLVSQNFSCGICKTSQSLLKKSLAIDHCHNTGKVRGLLCNNCNTGLGQFKDNINSLKSAIKYLQK